MFHEGENEHIVAGKPRQFTSFQDHRDSGIAVQCRAVVRRATVWILQQEWTLGLWRTLAPLAEPLDSTGRVDRMEDPRERQSRRKRLVDYLFVRADHIRLH